MIDNILIIIFLIISCHIQSAKIAFFISSCNDLKRKYHEKEVPGYGTSKKQLSNKNGKIKTIIMVLCFFILTYSLTLCKYYFLYFQ